MALLQKKTYTNEEMDNLTEEQQAELIDGQILKQASPSKTHQTILRELLVVIDKYIKAKRNNWEVFPAPFDVFLNHDESECFIPDISVICNPDIIKENGCYGPPDWIIEITSPSTANKDYLLKSIKYQVAGVKEYWIVNPKNQTITVYFFLKEDFTPWTYTFKDKVKVNIFEDLIVNFIKINTYLNDSKKVATATNEVLGSVNDESIESISNQRTESVSVESIESLNDESIEGVNDESI